MKTPVVLSLSIFVTAIIGDYIVSNTKFSQSLVFRACADSAVHATIGLLSSILFFTHENVKDTMYFFNIAFCTFLSSFIDIDHLFVAGSLQWKDLTNLSHRGILHCTTFWLAITIILLLYSYMYKKINIYILTWMLTIAYTSHHIRDGNRRGLWLYPYGHTQPLHKHLYLFVISVLPNFLIILSNYWKPSLYNKHAVIDYKSLV
ncbi:transmembrane protein 267-like [Achroia grisella]|uniref:transmembrane protein 267-like n=1 Tax=Achroia grisella TaxID=688607 RepID=UPI0027D35184|nr:transmembrane protein 267-like [Achroia grisella]